MAKSTKQSKTAFVLALPLTMSAEEVTAKAKEVGLEFDPKYVYNVRSRAKSTGKSAAKKRGPQKKGVAAKAAKPTGAPRGRKPGKAGTKTAFVLGLGDLPAAEVVAKAKAAGVSLTVGHVYAVRSLHKRKHGAGASNGARPVGRPAGRPAAHRAGGSPSEARLVELILGVGFARASELIKEVRAKAHALTLG